MALPIAWWVGVFVCVGGGVGVWGGGVTALTGTGQQAGGPEVGGCGQSYGMLVGQGVTEKDLGDRQRMVY